MSKIYKYELGVDGQCVSIPNVEKFLSVDCQPGVGPVVWVISGDSGYEYEVVAWGTGWDIPKDVANLKYLGTVQDEYGYVWHYFAKCQKQTLSDDAIAELLRNSINSSVELATAPTIEFVYDPTKSSDYFTIYGIADSISSQTCGTDYKLTLE